MVIMSIVVTFIHSIAGCGKTLSFKLASDNLIGCSQSNHVLFQNMSKILVSSYQCSESTTASEVSLLFKRAEDRQSNFDRYQIEATDGFVQQERCCVFLDEVVSEWFFICDEIDDLL
jgi:hypothetical protein